MDATQHDKKRYFSPWLCWALAAAIYFLQNGLLVLPEVLTGELQKFYVTTDAGVGVFSSIFLFSWALMQIPAGLILDHFDSRKVLTIFTFIAGISCFLLSFSNSFFWSLFYRLLMGIGGSFGFVAALYLGRSWFSASVFPLIVGLTEASSGVSEIGFNIYFGMLKQWMHWHALLFFVALAWVVLAVLIYLFVHDKKPERIKEKVNVWADFLATVKTPRLWVLGLYAGFGYAHFVVMADLWGVRFLMMHYNIEEWLAILLNGAVILGYTVGCPFIGSAARVVSVRYVLFISAAFEMLFLYIVNFVPLDLELGAIALFILGFFTSATILSFDIAEEIVPGTHYGVAAGFINTLFGGIGIIMMPLIGYMMEQEGQHLVNEALVICITSVIAVAIAAIIALHPSFKSTAFKALH